jgi:hypothetical protein
MPKVRRQKLPEALLRHLLTRMRQRGVSDEKIVLLAQWLDTDPEVPTANGSRNFPA